MNNINNMGGILSADILFKNEIASASNARNH